MYKLNSCNVSVIGLWALCVPFSASAQDVPLEQTQFTEYVAQKLRQEIGAIPIATKYPLAISVGAIDVSLSRIYAFCQTNRERCASEVDSFAKGTEQIAKERNTPIDSRSVRLVVRSSEYIKRAQASLGPNGPTLQSKSLVGDLVVVAVLDTPRAIRPLDNRDLTTLKLTPDELQELGRANLEASLKPLSEVAKPAGPGQIGKIGGNVFDTSRVLLSAQPTSLASAQGGSLVVSLPATDLLLYMSDFTPTSVDALRTMCRDVMSKVANPLSTSVLRWTSSGWEVVP